MKFFVLAGLFAIVSAAATYDPCGELYLLHYKDKECKKVKRKERIRE